MLFTTVASPVGELVLARDDKGITALLMSGGTHKLQPEPSWLRDDTAFDDVRAQLEEYFVGDRVTFDLPLHPSGTEFQRRVWQALREIPYGQTASYGATAQRIGAPGSARAVGAANGRNPISIIVPCHRVIGSNGSLTGYAGGVDAKKWLLGHEASHAGLFAAASG